MLSRCFLDCSVGVGVFVTGLSQISSFFSWYDKEKERKTKYVFPPLTYRVRIGNPLEPVEWLKCESGMPFSCIWLKWSMQLNLSSLPEVQIQLAEYQARMHLPVVWYRMTRLVPFSLIKRIIVSFFKTIFTIYTRSNAFQWLVEVSYNVINSVSLRYHFIFILCIRFYELSLSVYCPQACYWRRMWLSNTFSFSCIRCLILILNPKHYLSVKILCLSYFLNNYYLNQVSVFLGTKHETKQCLLFLKCQSFWKKKTLNNAYGSLSTSRSENETRD